MAISVRVRWEELREGLVEESKHYTTLDPLPDKREASFNGDSGVDSSTGQWFVTARWVFGDGNRRSW